MGRKVISIRTPGILALALSCGLLAMAPQAGAQSFGSMGMVDFEAARDSFFNSADVDGDFALSGEEQLSAMGASNAALFECQDSDGDGQCSYSEFLDSGEALFGELDRNGDGRLTADEVQSGQ